MRLGSTRHGTVVTPRREPVGVHRSWARVDDFTAGTAAVFPGFEIEVATHHIDEVHRVLQDVADAAERGWWALGFLSYEAAAGLDPALPVRPADHSATALPLTWFGLTPEPPLPAELVSSRAPYQAGPWRADWSWARYEAAFGRVKEAIGEGRTYQCNLTTALSGPFTGDELSFYADLAHAQHSRHCMYVDLGAHVIASASPELFFEWGHGAITTRPMKGTAARGHTPEQDARLRDALLASTKEQAENIIIVDLLRNDLAKFAAVGSVRVQSLLTPEAYPTVWQLTSQITAEPAAGTSFVDVMTALFPCGSVTGAPKAETMRIISDIEGRRRGIYCGAIGWVAPPTEPVRARFNVAIRTAHLDRGRGRCEYGVGSGITWGSDAVAEFAELRAKHSILTGGDDGVTGALTRRGAAGAAR